MTKTVPLSGHARGSIPFAAEVVTAGFIMIAEKKSEVEEG